LFDFGVRDLLRAKVVNDEQTHLVLRSSGVRVFENLEKDQIRNEVGNVFLFKTVFEACSLQATIYQPNYLHKR
jgi:hypothetical protein